MRRRRIDDHAAEVGMAGQEAVKAPVQHRLDHGKGFRLARRAEGMGMDLEPEAMGGLDEGLGDAGMADGSGIVAAADAMDVVLRADGNQLRDLGLMPSQGRQAASS
ncbi:hypothetical protein [Paracoccus benzoatiresistens]|uniref:Uncharacterized protein n=1 Tax=Paracoccus benzoatiresistens TaxID=2997341 RepID=A0ABT4IZQ5_9RHOB|nr:hypothetical protein [Paracoccus sp. EF6]MCZ0960332.1 hypothetical protein [Paracoccus sp. EF6]